MTERPVVDVPSERPARSAEPTGEPSEPPAAYAEKERKKILETAVGSLPENQKTIRFSIDLVLTDAAARIIAGAEFQDAARDRIQHVRQDLCTDGQSGHRRAPEFDVDHAGFRASDVLGVRGALRPAAPGRGGADSRPRGSAGFGGAVEATQTTAWSE